MNSMLTSTAMDNYPHPFNVTPRASGGPIVAAIGHLSSRTVNIAGSIKTAWRCERSNGWTPCRSHLHYSPDAAVACWRRYFKTQG